jgi:hypothetical protein
MVAKEGKKGGHLTFALVQLLDNRHIIIIIIIISHSLFTDLSWYFSS